MTTSVDPRLARQLAAHLDQQYPEYRLVEIVPLAPDSGATQSSTAKAAGFGMPLRLRLVDGRGARLDLVWRTSTANEFGHDRRSDRAANAILAHDDFRHIPRHVRALEVGAVGRDGELVALPDGAELYLLTTYAEGTLYADDLRRIARDGRVTERDLARLDALAAYLAALHAPLLPDPVRYRRAWRDLVGSGEGIYGIVDGYPAGVPGAPAARLRTIERLCAEWRWRARDAQHRLVRTHGDFHPFNVVFSGDTELALLDASRGTAGDAADDVCAMAVNFVFFALAAPAAWRDGLGLLWHRFWRGYAERRPDPALASFAPPFFAWRALVVCNPRFYPQLTGAARDVLLGLATRGLERGELSPAWADELFASQSSTLDANGSERSRA